LRILLDTCTFLWLAEGDPDLSDRVREAIVDLTNEVYLSPTSVWEIVVKQALGRLVAQAVAEGCTLATPDSLIRRHPVSTIW